MKELPCFKLNPLLSSRPLPFFVIATKKGTASADRKKNLEKTMLLRSRLALTPLFFRANAQRMGGQFLLKS
jgi:hypothetical protein